MPIRPFLGGQAFEPDVIRIMAIAFDGACEALGLSIRDDAATRIVAQKIIELAEGGVRDADALRDMTVREFSRAAEHKPEG